MFTLTMFQYIVGGMFLVLAIHYLLLVYWVDRPVRILNVANEGFTGETGQLKLNGGATEPGGTFITNPYDAFYAKVYDQLIQGADRTRFEVQDIERSLLQKWPKHDVRLLVLGSATGHAVDGFRKAGYSTTGADTSQAMLEFARTKYPESEFVNADMINRSSWQPGTWTHAFIPYFTIYYAEDKDMVFQNLATWVKPGGGICIHLVNKYKFDPLIEAASPFPAFSIQRYVQERVTRSDVVFDKFTYTGDFQLSAADQNMATFRETFRFKDESRPTRVQEHRLFMPSLKNIVETAERAGFKFLQMTDMLIIGYEYQYLFYFTR